MVEDIPVSGQQLSSVAAIETLIHNRIEHFDRFNLPNGWTNDYRFAKSFPHGAMMPPQVPPVIHTHVQAPLVPPPVITPGQVSHAVTPGQMPLVYHHAPVGLGSRKRKLNMIGSSISTLINERKLLIEAGIGATDNIIKEHDARFLVLKDKYNKLEDDILDNENTPPN